jgi:DNA polymerase-1
VDAHTLKNFVGECPQLNHIIKWKEADHIVSSGTVSLLPYVDDNDVLHGEFNQYATNTGRFSSKNPNCQNIASYKGDLLDRVKPFFVVQRKEADPFRKQLIARGYSGKTKRVYVDFSQVELRILAHYSQDPKLLQTYREGGDIHDTVERAVFGTGKSVDPVTGDSIDGPNRRKSKTINFGINYGLTPEGFARRITEVTLEEARSFYQKHGEQFPGIEQLRVKLVNQMIADGGFFINMFGRRRQIPLILSRENWEQRRGARQAIGSLIQGTSADVTKISMWLTWKELRRRGLSSELVQTIHDENVTDCPEEEFEEVVRIKKQIMENFPCFSVPITVDADYSETNWDEKHTVRD